MRGKVFGTAFYGLVALVVTGCSGNSTGPERFALEGSSWDVRLAPKATNWREGLGLELLECSDVSLSLHVEQGAGGPSLLLGHAGFAQRIPLRVTEHGYEAVGHTLLPAEGACQSANQLEASKLAVFGVDTGADGVADRVSGGGLGTGSRNGDVVYDIEFSLMGGPDVTPPSILPLPSQLLPLDGLWAPVSEPLPTGATLTLEGTSNVVLTPLIDERAGVITAFRSDEVLPFGGTWTTVATGSDFVGHSLTAGTELRTLPDPGLFTEDGFEGVLAAAPAAVAQVVDGVGVIPAISGDRSLWVAEETVMLHLKRAPGQTQLRARAQWFYSKPQLDPSPTIVVGVVGNAQPSFSEGNREPPTLLSEHADFGYATGVTELTLALNGDGDDVIVGIRGAVTCEFAQSPYCRALGGVLLDDLRLE